MKQFNKSFFKESNFLKSVTDYDYSNTKGECCHICYNVNDAFISIMGASVVSVLENNKAMAFTFHIFTDGCSHENMEKIERLAKQYCCRCILYVLNMEPFADFHIKVERFSRITYARLYMPKVLKKYTHKYIYLDADTMCTASLQPLWSLNLSSPMGAVSEREEAIDYRAGYLKLKNGKYFNDGVMMVDISSWEAQGITELCFSYQGEPRERFLGQSQDVLNLVFDGQNDFLPSKYNVYDGGEFDRGGSVIVHWTGRRKPWQMVLSDFDRQWRQYNKLSPWTTITNLLPIKKAANYHDFKYWGIYHKGRGDYGKYIQGMLWYSLLRICYKCGCK